MTQKEVLIAARAQIADPARWTKGQFARTARGNKARVDNSKAVCFCIMGAIALAAKLKPGRAVDELSAPLNEVIGLRSDSWRLVDWNDAPDRTHAEVLAAFDRAIELAGDGT